MDLDDKALLESPFYLYLLLWAVSMLTLSMASVPLFFLLCHFLHLECRSPSVSEVPG